MQVDIQAKRAEEAAKLEALYAACQECIHQSEDEREQHKGKRLLRRIASNYARLTGDWSKYHAS
jgi:hypothetical protein